MAKFFLSDWFESIELARPKKGSLKIGENISELPSHSGPAKLPLFTLRTDRLLGLLSLGSWQLVSSIPIISAS